MKITDPPPCFSISRDLVLGAEERAGQVDRDGLVPAGLGHAGAGAALAQRAGVVEGDVESAEPLDRQRHQGLGIVFGAHVAGQCGGLPAFGLDLGDQAVEFGLAAGADDELGAFGREQLGGRAADAGAGAGDDGHLVLQASHDFSRCWWDAGLSSSIDRDMAQGRCSD